VRLSLRFILAACSILVVDACTSSRLTGRRPGSDMMGIRSENFLQRSLREALSRCDRDPSGGVATPSAQAQCRLAATEAARLKSSKD
jgi:hypothetical protein